ncbi:LysM domain-containing protein [Halobacillus alkaliphilus]|uniref:LysM domain-containing protein n=1 Tax=Halobacillus alkaliphilus TaxID=396056 RepID=A0A1I2KFW2_9BACI|nr:LysM peptidoglycan-binding domain-containing protein [Halobacillus alkaliphilus]SFF64117.1 LysM domain-containing protein [Halobacillus alkaliphilus]
MKKTKYLVPLLAAGMTFGVGAGSASAENSTVTFERGDTLWSIAQEYSDVTVEDLYKWNPGIDADVIQPGSKITVKTDETIREEVPTEEFHTVTPGSTLYSIANLHKGVTLTELFEWNPGIDPWNLQIGSEVRVSPPEDQNSHEIYHTVEPGETLYSIANLHKGVTLEDLYELNPGINPRNLPIGSEVQVYENGDKSGPIADGVTKQEAEKLVRKYKDLENEPAMKVEYDRMVDRQYLVHVYENVDNHTATYGWYLVDPKTGDIRNYMK